MISNNSFVFANGTRSVPTMYVGQEVYLVDSKYPIPASRIIESSRLIRRYEDSGSHTPHYDCVEYVFYNNRTKSTEIEFDFNYGISWYTDFDMALNAIKEIRKSREKSANT